MMLDCQLTFAYLVSIRSKIIVLLKLVPGLIKCAEDRATDHALLRRSGLRYLLLSV